MPVVSESMLDENESADETLGFVVVAILVHGKRV